MAKDKKNINVEISYEAWKKLKIISLIKDIYLQELVVDILETVGKEKKYEVEEKL